MSGLLPITPSPGGRGKGEMINNRSVGRVHYSVRAVVGREG